MLLKGERCSTERERVRACSGRINKGWGHHPATACLFAVHYVLCPSISLSLGMGRTTNDWKCDGTLCLLLFVLSAWVFYVSRRRRGSDGIKRGVLDVCVSSESAPKPGWNSGGTVLGWDQLSL